MTGLPNQPLPSDGPAPMTLDRLLDAVGVPRPAWSGEWPEVSGVASDSRRVSPGDLFVAIVGERFDGRRFVPTAIEAGAVAVLGPSPEASSPVPEGIASSSAPEAKLDTSVPWVDVAEPRHLMGALSRLAFGSPGESLRMVGITGTNGKSSLVILLAAMLEAAGESTARLGTLGYFFAGREWKAGGRTTPEAPDLHRMLAGMQRAGAQAASMEVSSHALELGRVEDLDFDLAVFTNLSRDHLDFHGDLESYFAAKKKLFSQLKPGGMAVVHLESEAGENHGDWGHRLTQELRRRGQSVLTCGQGEAEVRPLEVRLDLDGLEARLDSPRGEIRLRSKLLGRFHLLNLITAAACGVALGLPMAAIERGLASVDVVPGRLERIPGPVPALVDYAHTPAALEAALRATRELTDRPIIVVFGCGGERDRGKRPEMARAAGLLADVPILTSDNPRREDPARILADAEKGLIDCGCENYHLEPDRRAAIELAVAKAREIGAAVVVAGKGHEVGQDLGHEVIPFDDRAELAAALAGEPGPSGPGRSQLPEGDWGAFEGGLSHG